MTRVYYILNHHSSLLCLPPSLSLAVCCEPPPLFFFGVTSLLSKDRERERRPDDHGAAVCTYPFRAGVRAKKFQSLPWWHCLRETWEESLNDEWWFVIDQNVRLAFFWPFVPLYSAIYLSCKCHLPGMTEIVFPYIIVGYQFYPFSALFLLPLTPFLSECSLVVQVFQLSTFWFSVQSR